MQKITAYPNTPAITPAMQNLIDFIQGMDPNDLHSITTNSLFLLADSELSEGKRWILVRLNECFHLMAKEDIK